MSEDRPTRAERRRTTERRILAAARDAFARLGYERTTIRAVAAEAAVDPALVMQYYGSKQQLFARASGDGADGADDPERLIGQVLESVGVRTGGLPETSLATLRSMLTHPEAAQRVRTALDGRIDEIGAALDGPDARERAALVVTALLGVTLGHRLLGLDALRDLTADRVATLLRPGLQALLRPPAPDGA